MKKNRTTLHVLVYSLAAGLIAFAPAHAADNGHEGHDHEKEHDHHAHEKKHDHNDHESEHDHEEAVAGPNGGRVITSVEPHLEFLATADRKVQIVVLDEDFRPTTIGEQTIRAVGGSRSKPTRMNFVKQGDVFVSDVELPDGNDFPMVVQIKPTADAKTVVEKFNLNLSDCPTCEYKEYACVCDHGEGEDDHKGHDH